MRTSLPCPVRRPRPTHQWSGQRRLRPSRATPVVFLNLKLCTLKNKGMDDSWFAYDNPVMAEDGYIYERTFIEAWLTSGNRKSPKTLQDIGTSLSYPFEYYQIRNVWARSKGLPEPKQPEHYGLIPAYWDWYPPYLVSTIKGTSIHYNSDDFPPVDFGEFPPLPLPDDPCSQETP